MLLKGSSDSKSMIILYNAKTKIETIFHLGTQKLNFL